MSNATKRQDKDVYSYLREMRMGVRWPEASCAASPSAFLGSCCCCSAAASVVVGVGAIAGRETSRRGASERAPAWWRLQSTLWRRCAAQRSLLICSLPLLSASFYTDARQPGARLPLRAAFARRRGRRGQSETGVSGGDRPRRDGVTL